MTATVPAAPVQMTEKQERVLAVFLAMERAAVHYMQTGRRISGDNPENKFEQGYGICDNISRMAKDSRSAGWAYKAKDNYIRLIPTYSGEYHYPVKPDPASGRSAENEWDCSDNKWSGVYGENRLAQLRDLIRAIRDEWREEMTEDLTPAQRLGIRAGDMVIRLKDSRVFTLVRDDGSRAPYFEPLGGGDREAIYVDKVCKVVAEDMPKGSVKALIAKARKVQAKRAALQAKIDAMQLAQQKLMVDLALIDNALADQHGVKRIK